MKQIIFYVFFGINLFVLPSIASGQADSLKTAKDINRAGNTAVNNEASDSDYTTLDFHLSESEYLYYYGTDDTAIALIHMFFRKREFYPYIHGHPPDMCLSAYLTLALYPLLVPTLGTRFLIHRMVYTKQRLLYALLDRENSYPLLPEIAKQMRAFDFRY